MSRACQNFVFVVQKTER